MNVSWLNNLEIKQSGSYMVGLLVGYEDFRFRFKEQILIENWEKAQKDYYQNRELPVNKLLDSIPRLVFRFICV